jgi:hypothetical protein
MYDPNKNSSLRPEWWNRLHQLWTKNVGLPGYDKAEWHDFEAHLNSLLNTPEIDDFDRAVPLEAAHQVARWTAAHDSGKNPEDWFWLLGYLAGKALASVRSGDLEKAKHHCISSAAALRNWHAHIRSGSSAMRLGTKQEEQ